MGLKTIIPYSMGEMWIEYSQVHRTPCLAKQVGGVDSFLPSLLHEMKKKKKKMSIIRYTKTQVSII